MPASFFTLSVLACALFIAYLAGSIPFGLMLGHVFGEGDIRAIGSGNIGATNMLRTGRKGLAALTLALDFLKGPIAIGMAQGLCNHFFGMMSGDFVIPPHIEYFAGVAAVLGHVFPCWLDFKGGKGVATTLGVFFATQPVIGLCTVIGWLTIFYLARVSSLAAVCSIAVSPILGFKYVGSDFGCMALVLAVIVIARHKDNIRRLRRGKEDIWEKKSDDAA